MPTYVYECKTCEKVWELEQRITENAITECNCERKQPVRRLIQPVGIAFKGEGFHINDYAAKPSAPANSSPSSQPKSEAEVAAPAATSTSESPASAPTPAPVAPKPASD
jgi:hypothetical protein